MAKTDKTSVHHILKAAGHFSKWSALLFACFAFLTTQGQRISIHEIPTLGQLPVNAIHRIFLDKEGYLWYGTIGGLCRDDGYQVSVFRSDMFTPRRLNDNCVTCITEDRFGRLWYGTRKGVFILDKKDYSIRPLDIKRLGGSSIYRVDHTSDGSVWVDVAGRLYRYRTDGHLIHVYPTRENGHDLFLGGFCESRSGEVVMTYFNGGVWHLDKKANRLVPYPKGLKKQNCAAILQDSRHDYFWLMTWGDGIVRFDPKARCAKDMYAYQPLPVTSGGQTDGTMLYAVQDDRLGYLWCTTKKDLAAFCVGSDNRLKQVDLSEVMPAQNKMLNDIISDPRGNLWVTAYDQPSFMVEFSNDKPSDYSLPALRERTHYNPAIVAIADAGDGIVWLSQERVGLFLYNLPDNTTSGFMDAPTTKDLPLGEVKLLAPTKRENSVWAVPENTNIICLLEHSGLNMRLKEQTVLTQLHHPDFIQSLLESTSGRYLWIGSTEGLFRYDLNMKQLKPMLHSTKLITGLAQTKVYRNEDGPEGTLWACSMDSGLYRLTPGGTISRYKINRQLTCLALTNNGNVWIGTEQGELLLFDAKTHRLKNVSLRCGLSGNQVNRLVTDVYDHVWIDTNTKLIEFNPKNGSYQTYRTNKLLDGRQESVSRSPLLWRILPTAVCQSSDGRIFFGGIPGICATTPSESLEQQPKSVRALITDVKVQGQSLFFTRQSKVNSGSKVELGPNDHNIEIDFSTLNYRYADKIRYAYRMRGVDKDWVYTPDGHNSAFYNSLAKGTYIFQVKATDENGIWSDTISEIMITRLPAFYETWEAYTLYALIVASILCYCLYIYLKRIQTKNNELWADSKEMIHMPNYLDNKITSDDSEVNHLDKLLLDKAVKAVEDHLSEGDFDVNALAEAMNMSRSTLTRKLKTITGRIPLEFIRKVKMRHARQMLENRTKSVSEVATDLGYSDRKYFTSCFKAEFGTTPSNFQKGLSWDKGG
jgi:ligand-binding sensor domain-containing protein/AraC-like DNA-binding protein